MAGNKTSHKETEHSASTSHGTTSQSGSKSHTTTHGSTHDAGEKLSHTTTDRKEIQQWAEKRGAKPACVEGTGGKGDVGLLRLEFPGKPHANDSKLHEISWEEFFQKFDEQGLALVYQDHTADGKGSNFNKLVSREESKPKTRSAH